MEIVECVWVEELILANEWWDEQVGDWVESLNDGGPNELERIHYDLERMTALKKLVVSGYRGIEHWRPLERLLNLKKLITSIVLYSG